VSIEQRIAVKTVKNAILYNDGTIRLDNVRCSYPHLIEPYAGDDDNGNKQEPAYGIVFLLPKATHAAAKDLCKFRIEQLMQENKVKAIPADKKFLRDGDMSGKAENEKMFTVSAREKRAPVLRTPSKAKIIRGKTETVTVGSREVAVNELFYGGCWVNGIIRPWWQNNKFGKRVNAGLVAVQFLKDDEAFGEGRITEDQIDDSFDALEDEESGFADAGSEDDFGGL
jgi:hypothetical protein